MNDLITTSLVQPDPTLDACLATNEAAGLRSIDVAPNEGKLYYLFAKMIAAKRILEVGTLGGYSAIWFAKAVSPLHGKVITLELSPDIAAVATENVARAGFASTVEIRVGAALDTLAAMEAEGVEKFDLIFLDADKANNANYLAYALRFAKKGTVIIVDNVVRQGRVLTDQDAPEQGIRDAFELLKNEKRVECTAVQTVGPKDWDGFAVARVVD